MSKFIHTPEQAAEWANYRDRWIDIAFRTDPMTDEEKDLCRDAVNTIYKMVNKESPRVVFVDSPLMAEMVAACSAQLIGENNAATNAATDSATIDATRAATRAATNDATWAATWAATIDATRAATRDATEAATWDATWAATIDATYAATRSATWDATMTATWTATNAATRAATEAATWDAAYAATIDATWAATSVATYAATIAATYAANRAATIAATYAANRAANMTATMIATRDVTWTATWDATEAIHNSEPHDNHLNWYVVPYSIKDICQNIAGPKSLNNLNSIKNLFQGGNQWAYNHAFYEWFRHVAKLPIDWSKWIPWNTLGEHSGPRYVHEKFVIISDFPTLLKMDNENRPHSSTGPFCQWRDGFSLYAWHGIRVPAWIIEQPHLITIEKIDGESNAEIRRVMLDRYGFLRYLQEKKAQTIDQDIDEGGEVMTLYSMPTDDDNGNPMMTIHLKNSTPDPDGKVREYVVRVPPTCKTVWEARNWTFELNNNSRFASVS